LRPAKSCALAVGVVFLTVGVLGFIPGITVNYSQMSFAGSSELSVGEAGLSVGVLIKE
jgi:hypothetical protein